MRTTLFVLAELVAFSAQAVDEERTPKTPEPRAAQLTGRPGVVGGTGNRFIITVPPSMPPSTWYRASIEAVGLRGAKSQRVDFNPVMLMRAQAPGGPGSVGTGGTGPVGTGPAATPQTSAPATSLAGQACPVGQFVTGFSSTGTVLCASPPASAPATGPASAPAR